MMERSSKLTLRATVQSMSDASKKLLVAGDAVLVERGRPRWLVICCPCGCGDQIPVNLDARSGKAWRIYRNARYGLSIHPSVWRDTDCESHFIVWRNEIFLFGKGRYSSGVRLKQDELESLGQRALSKMDKALPSHYVEIADNLNEVPWDVLEALRYLSKRGFVLELQDQKKGYFERISHP